MVSKTQVPWSRTNADCGTWDEQRDEGGTPTEATVLTTGLKVQVVSNQHVPGCQLVRWEVFRDPPNRCGNYAPVVRGRADPERIHRIHENGSLPSSLDDRGNASQTDALALARALPSRPL